MDFALKKPIIDIGFPASRSTNPKPGKFSCLGAENYPPGGVPLNPVGMRCYFRHRLCSEGSNFPRENGDPWLARDLAVAARDLQRVYTQFAFYHMHFQRFLVQR